MTKITKAKRALLEAMLESRNGISVYDADKLGSGGLGLANLVKQRLAFDTKYAAGVRLWTITDAGRAALSESSK